MIDIHKEQPWVVSGVEIGNDAQARQHKEEAATHRQRRQRRIKLAWSTSLVSKIATIGVQVLAVPLVYRALGEGGYAAYAAVTASAGLIGVLNLGIGGSLVTPIAEAAVKQDERRQAVLVQAGLIPLFLLCILGSIAVIPTVAFVPLRTLFGRVGVTGSWDLRIAALIAASGTLATIPLSAVGFLRQAYQEMHLSNLIGALSNFLLCIALLVAVKLSASLAIFVAVFVLIPVGASAMNFGWLFWQRPFLLQSKGRGTWVDSRYLLSDGVRFLGASLSNVLVFQWPVYWIARTLPASTSSMFAICIQATVLPLGFVFGFLQPLWSSTADALARADRHWLDGYAKRARVAVVAVGGCAFLVTLIFGERLLHLWLRRPMVLAWPIRGLMGAYFMFAIWEQFHFYMALGSGRLREATTAQFQRAIGFAIAVPFLTMIGGVTALWCGMCCSIVLWTAWRLPRLLHAQIAMKGQRWN